MALFVERETLNLRTSTPYLESAVEQTIIIRNAHLDDLPALVVLEENVWKARGVDPIGIGHFEAMYETYPEGLFVAESDGLVVGYTCLELTDFRFDPLPDHFRTFKTLTDDGYIKGVHNPNGTHHFGPTVLAVKKGAGYLLLRKLLDFCAEQKRPLLGSSCIPGFHEYVEKHRNLFTTENETAVALHYAISCVKMAGARMHPSLLTDYVPGRFPEVEKQDPTLKAYFRHPEFAFYRLIPGFLKDPDSHDFSVLFGQEF